MMATHPSVVVHVASAVVQSLHLLGMHVHRSKFASDVATSLPPASTGPPLLLLLRLEADDEADVAVVLDVVVPTTRVVTFDELLLVTVPP